MVIDGGVGRVAAHGIFRERKVRTPKGKVLGNAQAERSDTSATENIPPMAKTPVFAR